MNGLRFSCKGNGLEIINLSIYPPLILCLVGNATPGVLTIATTGIIEII